MKTGKASTCSGMIALSVTLVGILITTFGVHAEEIDITAQDIALGQRIGLAPMDEHSMDKITAQGSVRDDFQYLIDVYDGGPSDEAPEKAVTAFFQTVLPMFEFLTDYTISDVEYRDPDSPQVIANTDGSITIMLPSRIGEIAYRDLAVLGAESTPLGDLIFSNIRTVEGSRIILTRTEP
jgi:hypothetical protein